MAVSCPFSGYGFRPPRRAAVGRSGWRHNTAGGTRRPSTTTLPWTTRTTPRRLALGPAPQSSAGRHCNLTTPVDKAVSACSTTLSRPVPRVLGTSQTLAGPLDQTWFVHRPEAFSARPSASGGTVKRWSQPPTSSSTTTTTSSRRRSGMDPWGRQAGPATTAGIPRRSRRDDVAQALRYASSISTSSGEHYMGLKQPVRVPRTLIPLGCRPRRHAARIAPQKGV
jgi:hypothetical protein